VSGAGTRFPELDEDGFGPQDAAGLTGVSHETLVRIQTYLAVLDDWRGRLNLIGPSEGRHLWRRHVHDSLQLLADIRPDERRIVDLGSGAGFPGLILACALHGRSEVTLVEKSVRKAEFLETAIRETGLTTRVVNDRIDEAGQGRPINTSNNNSLNGYDLVTARALAPLPKLLGYASVCLKPSGRCLFLKGREATTELTQARESWTFDLSARASASNPEGQVLAISSLRRRT
jgi:16S rRNA (guanine527-N7)-methyltransferase